MKPLIVIMSTLATVSMIAFVGAFQACTGDTTQVKEVLDSADVQAVLEDVRVGSGLNEFNVVMDGSNNTADIVDRNILFGQIFIQPTRTAEFIVLDFTVQPTGASFPE